MSHRIILHRRKGGRTPLQCIHAVRKVQKRLVAAFEFTIAAARGFKINPCAARGVKKVGQHCHRGL